MTVDEQAGKFCVEYDLTVKRLQQRHKHPAVHQKTALNKLRQWRDDSRRLKCGGILVLPTGGGKTFTAVHFACREFLSQDYKVLWLAHTHHLLEQAFETFADCAGAIAEPKDRLRVRVVSGMSGIHYPVSTIRPEDDVVISSLPLACRAMKDNPKHLQGFLNSSQGKLLVVFDEAHHAPAPSHRNLLRDLRSRHPGLVLLGLTATPTYGDERKQGWLAELFPQGIVHQVTASELMAAGILARPVLHEERTSFAPGFNDREYRKWLGTNMDVPEEIISALAENKSRNDYIVNALVSQKEKWGKTIIFADRWYQCDYLRQALIERGVKADVVYSHIDANPGSPEARNRRGADENSRVIQAFKDNELEAIINVKMLTEGTDIPDAQTAFLTRQTTSRNLLTQMVGRVLRGPKFGGTAEAHIVSFIDDWKQRINWAAYDQLAAGEMDDEIRELRKRPPVHLISIELVRRLARQMDSGSNVNPSPYRQFLPIGWYLADFITRVTGSDDEEAVRHPVMVFEHNEENYKKFLTIFPGSDLSAWQEYELSLETVQDQVNTWQEDHFAGGLDHIGSDLQRDLFALGRHVAQSEGQLPRFIPFDAHKVHDLDQLAHANMEKDLGPIQTSIQLRGEYARKDRSWSVFYPSFDMFKSQYDGCVNRLVNIITGVESANNHSDGASHPESLPNREPDEDTKKKVKQRDGMRCLCCGCGGPLQVDHIIPRYLGGNNEPDNLQTLCKYCNRNKGITQIDFRKRMTDLKEALPLLTAGRLPSSERARDVVQWEMFMRETVNMFYRCMAVSTVDIGQRGDRFHHWNLTLHYGNNPKWLSPHLAGLIERIRRTRVEAGLTPAPQKITVK